MPEITYCPAASAHTDNFDPHIFAARHLRPVNAHFIAEGAAGGGIAFEDYNRMHVQLRKIGGGRRFPIPRWALRPEQLREVIVRTMMKRAFNHGIINQYKKLTAQQQLAVAQKSLIRSKPAVVALLDRMCAEYVKCKKELEPSAIKNRTLRVLEIEIENLDTRLRLLDKMPAILCGIVYHYYHRGASSPEIAALLHLKPPHVRIILSRLNKTAAELGLE